MSYSQTVTPDQAFDIDYHGTTNHIVPKYTLRQDDASSAPTLTMSLTFTRSGGDRYWSEQWTATMKMNGAQIATDTFPVGSYSNNWTSITCGCSFTVDFGTLSDAMFQITVKNADGTIELVIDPVLIDAPIFPSISFSSLAISVGQTITANVVCNTRYTYSLYAFVLAPASGDNRTARENIAQNASGDATYQFTPDPDTFAIGIRGKGNTTSTKNDHTAYFSLYIYCYVNGEQRYSAAYAASVTYPTFGSVSPPSELTAGAANTITLTNPNGYGYAVQLKEDGTTIEAPVLTQTGTWTPATADLAPLMPDALHKTFNCVMQTYYHGVLVGTPFALDDVTVKLREIDVCPQPSAQIEDDTELKATYGAYVLLQSRLHITASAGLRYGATLEALRISANGTHYTGTEAITDVLESLDYDTVTIEATDSRGVTAVTEYTISLVEWFTPRVTTLAVHRCTSAGVRSDNGDHVLIEWGVDFAPVNDLNTKSLTVRHPVGSSAVPLSAYQQTGQMIVAADTEHSYDISLVLQDAFATFSRTVRLSTAGVILDILAGGKGVAFGKVAETASALEVSPDWTLICQTLKLAGVDLATRLSDIEQRLTRGGL